MATFGSRLTELRKKKGVTQAEVAKYLGVTPKAVSFYENNEREAPNDVLKKLASYFNTSLDYLLARENTTEEDLEFFRITKEAQKNGLSSKDLKTALEFLNYAKGRDK